MTGLLILALVAGAIIVSREVSELARDIRAWMHNRAGGDSPNQEAARPALFDLTDIDWSWPNR